MWQCECVSLWIVVQRTQSKRYWKSNRKILSEHSVHTRKKKEEIPTITHGTFQIELLCVYLFSIAETFVQSFSTLISIHFIQRISCFVDRFIWPFLISHNFRSLSTHTYLAHNSLNFQETNWIDSILRENIKSQKCQIHRKIACKNAYTTDEKNWIGRKV